MAGEPTILPEGEFDALLMWHETGDLVGVATLGNCKQAPESRDAAVSAD